MLIDKNNINLRCDEDGSWIASCEALPGCHASGHSEYEAILNFQEAAKAHLLALKDTGRPILEVFEVDNEEDTMRPEYDFDYSKAERGKYYQRLLKEGAEIIVHKTKENLTSKAQEILRERMDSKDWIGHKEVWGK